MLQSKDSFVSRLVKVSEKKEEDFAAEENGSVKPECLQEGWQTSGSVRVVRMAFNLYCNGTPSVYDYEDAEKQLSECSCYTGQKC